MALSEFEIKRVERAADNFLKKRRPPAHVRKELDFGYEIHNQNVILTEIRPDWKNPDEIHHRPFARATYVMSKKHWKVYWMRQDLKWHSYEPVSIVKSIEEFFVVVDEDAHYCFFG